MSGVNENGNAAAAENKYIKLKVVGASSTLEFRLKMNTSLDRVMAEYSRRVDCPLHQLRFLYKGIRIDGRTPRMMQMEENDIIVVYDMSFWEPASAAGSRGVVD